MTAAEASNGYGAAPVKQLQHLNPHGVMTLFTQAVTLGKCYRCDVGRFKKKDLQDHFARAAAECAELLYVRSC